MGDPPREEHDQGNPIIGILIWISLFVIIVLTVCGFSFVICNQNNIMMMQQDTLDQVMETQQEPAVEVIATVALDPADKLLIAKVAMAESSTYEGMVAVVQTIYDRSDLWHMTPYDVVTAKSQYAAPINGMVNDEAMQAVTAVFEGGVRAFDEPVTHFITGGTSAYWTDGKVCRGVVGGNEFWY